MTTDQWNSPATAVTEVFDRAFTLVIGVEGGFTANPLDPGNWTGGKCQVGVCKGTKYGISAASYPTVDIANLTLDQAKAIYKRDYWDKVSGDGLPPPLALVTFDAAVNSGAGRAAKWLQVACGVTPDGAIGTNTLAAIAKGSLMAIVAESLSQRLLFMTGLTSWRTFGLGWTRRIVHVGAAAIAFDATPVVTVQTINPAPIVAALDDVRTAVREAMSERVAA